jgi:hypothetical protein
MQKLTLLNEHTLALAGGFRSRKNKTTQSNIADFSQPSLCYALVRLFKTTHCWCVESKQMRHALVI